MQHRGHRLPPPFLPGTASLPGHPACPCCPAAPPCRKIEATSEQEVVEMSYRDYLQVRGRGPGR